MKSNKPSHFGSWNQQTFGMFAQESFLNQLFNCRDEKNYIRKSTANFFKLSSQFSVYGRFAGIWLSTEMNKTFDLMMALDEVKESSG